MHRENFHSLMKSRDSQEETRAGVTANRLCHENFNIALIHGHPFESFSVTIFMEFPAKNHATC